MNPREQLHYDLNAVYRSLTYWLKVRQAGAIDRLVCDARIDELCLMHDAIVTKIKKERKS